MAAKELVEERNHEAVTSTTRSSSQKAAEGSHEEPN